MSNFENSLNQYGLHDTTVSNVVLEHDGILFEFKSGVYFLESNGRKANKTAACHMKIYIDNFDINSMHQHVEIKKIRKSKIIEIEFKVFLKFLEKKDFKIYLDYYSFFAKSILLNGFLGNFEIELKITEIEKITFDF